MRCPKGTRKNKKTGKCEQKIDLKTSSTNKRKHNSKTNSKELKIMSNNNEYLALTVENLNAINPEPVVAEKPKAKAKAAPKPRKMTDEQRNKLIANYREYWDSFINNEHNEIYVMLRKIAKKQYSKDEELAKFEEEFYQHFMANDEKFNEKYNRYYDQRLHNYLFRLRKQAENDEKLTDAEKAVIARYNARARANN